jgi:hypothetical protein
MWLNLLVPLLLLVMLGVAVARSVLPARPPPQVGTEFSAVLKGSGSPLGAHEVICVNPSCTPRAVLVFIPGNPGQPAFYSDFAERLSARLEAQVVVLGLAGHLTRPSASTLTWVERRRRYQNRTLTRDPLSTEP